MNDSLTVITVASWEERFVIGSKRLIVEKEPDTFIMYYYAEYSERTKNSRNQIRSLCEEKKVTLLEKMVSFKSPTDNWRIFEDDLHRKEWANKAVVVDISTMPRDTIWTIFYFLELSKSVISYVYNKPEKYSTDWLSRDPGIPRLLFRLSGISIFNRPTALLVVTGFDPERTEQLINYYEPKITYLGLQIGDQYENKRMNVKKHMDTARSYLDVQMFDIDAYSPDHGYSVLIRIIKEELQQYNVIAAALGPKPCSVALYRLWKSHPEIALAYAPSNDFNSEYSSGISGDGEIHLL